MDERIGDGIRSTISMSNTRKITARRKNRNENGIRAEFLGSNPHSNGDSFSRSWLERMATSHAIVGISIVSARGIKNEMRVRCIYLQGSRGAVKPIFRVKI